MPIPEELREWVEEIFHPVEFPRLEALPEERVYGECLKREGWIAEVETTYGLTREEAIEEIMKQGERKEIDPTEPYLPPELEPYP